MEQNKKCTPGERWKNECNDCVCTETGIGACTLRGCLTQEQSKSLRPTVYSLTSIRTVSQNEFNSASNFSCTPYEYFKLECNFCKCSSDGKGAKCTKKGCNIPKQ